MAVGTPVITSDLPVARELGEDQKHFYLVKPNSVEEIAGALKHLRSSPSLREYIKENVRQQVENYFTWERAGTTLIKAYESLGINLSKRV
ncbi:MAG: hypothetical protein N5P05_000006 [Chroococcopsis gigantea SAG 12.99]|jgi:glycosyltransferase involved in cell wall biosynthesis|nr:hypothetical protein [Chroococcopsis gigantea SAG 12.99]